MYNILTLKSTAVDEPIYLETTSMMNLTATDIFKLIKVFQNIEFQSKKPQSII